MRIELQKRIFLNFVLVIALFGVLGAFLGALLINRTILDEAQRRVGVDLRSAWSVLQAEMDRLGLFADVLVTGRRVDEAFSAPSSESSRVSLDAVRRQCGFHFLGLTDSRGRVILRTVEPCHTGDYLSNDPFIGRALKGQHASGFAVYGPQRLRAEGGNLEERAYMVFEPTPKAKARAKTEESAGMVLVAAAPVQDEQGNVKGALYAGVLLNRNYALVDRIRSVVFENRKYGGKDLGTVTVFQWDARVATNVTLANGNRAIGTRVSEEVYDKVLENNTHWYDRAFVVNDWYLSAYDPLHDTEGKVIGILYVGVLAKKYDDLKWSLWRLYGAISLGVAVFVLAVGFLFARRLTTSLSRLADAAGRITEGNLDLAVKEPAADDEVKDLTRAFNAMASSLKDRDERLRAANAALEEANRTLKSLNDSYLDMLGFVSHELKNTLGVIYTSARALDVGLVGPMSESQASLVHSISKSISSAVSMTRNYLDLARIEKGELTVSATQMDLSGEVLRPLLEELGQVMADRGIRMENRVPEGLRMKGDPSQLKIVFKNLLDNALKYGRQEGRVGIDFKEEGDQLRFEVWNEGAGQPSDRLVQLFEKFVHFGSQADGSRGTGLGLFITREIVRKHGGTIWAESREGEWMRFVFTLPSAGPAPDHEDALTSRLTASISG
ncbi:MAG: cache domain-containing protein [Deltaproteobacteria bacterium]|nr:cache domain-containing protein [Deltaproteobacteria bacterium]